MNSLRCPEGHCRIGIDLGGTKIEGILLRGADEALERKRIATPQKDYAAMLSAVVGLVTDLEQVVETDCSVGIGTPGSMQPQTRIMRNCNSTWLNGQTLLDDLEHKLGKRVRLANDADCFTLAQSALLKQEGMMFGVILGTGVGGGLSIGGRSLTGPNGLAGEWGHTPLDYFRDDELLPEKLALLENRLQDRRCYCGRKNCIETFLSGPGLAATHTCLWHQRLTPEAISCDQSDSGELTRRLYVHMLARCLAQIINTIDPETIVLGGGLSNMTFLYQKVPAVWADYAFCSPLHTSLQPPVFGDSSGVYGAANLWPL